MNYVLLPAYNEESAIESLIVKLNKHLTNYTIVIVDDGSTDKTLNNVMEFIDSGYPIKLICHGINLGLGQSMIDGLEYIANVATNFDTVVTMDSDNTHEPRYIKQALDKLADGYDLILLSRYTNGGEEIGLSRYRSLLSKGAGLFLKLFFPIRGVKEYSCGFRVFRASLLKDAINRYGKRLIQLPHLGFVVTAELLIRFRSIHADMVELPFTLRYDQKVGKSKNKPLRTIFGYFMLVKTYWRKNG